MQSIGTTLSRRQQAEEANGQRVSGLHFSTKQEQAAGSQPGQDQYSGLEVMPEAAKWTQASQGCPLQL